MASEGSINVQARVHRRWLLECGVWAARLRMRRLAVFLAGLTCVDVRVSNGDWQHVCVRRAAGFDSSRAVQWTGTAYPDPHATVSISIGETAGIPEGVLN